MGKIAAIAMLALLGGCVSESTTLVNKDGKTVQCAGWGFGVIGAPIAMAHHHSCVENAHEAGYSEAPH